MSISAKGCWRPRLFGVTVIALSSRCRSGVPGSGGVTYGLPSQYFTARQEKWPDAQRLALAARAGFGGQNPKGEKVVGAESARAEAAPRPVRWTPCWAAVSYKVRQVFAESQKRLSLISALDCPSRLSHSVPLKSSPPYKTCPKMTPRN